MKNTISLLFFALCSAQLLAQTPQGINYQSAVRDTDGTALINQAGEFQISILEDAINGDLVHQETHDVISNNFGLVDFVIGEGDLVEGEFANIPWGDHIYFVEVGLDIGQGLEIMGTQQLMSVP